MPIPKDATGVAILLVLVVPGIVYQTARMRLRGPVPDERDATARVLRAMAVSAVLALAYVAILGSLIVDFGAGRGYLSSHPRAAALVGLVLVFAIPAALAVCEQLIRVSINRHDWWRRLWERDFGTYDPTPTAWDFAFSDRSEGWVRVLMQDGTWLGGWFGTNSTRARSRSPASFSSRLSTE